MNQPIAFLITLLVFVISTSVQAKTTISPLAILESYTIPATEVSGLAWRLNPKTKHRELIVVSDNSHTLIIIDWEERKKSFAPKKFDIKPLEGPASTDSGWESVFSDESGRIFIIQEDPSQILVVSSDLKSIEKKITLIPPSAKGEAEQWASEPNSRGEGLLPLKNGNIIVVKEKKPLRLIEFAKKGGKASGYDKSVSIEFRGTFPIPTESNIEFSPVFTWKFDEEGERLMEDASGLNVDADGKLYLLGDNRGWIASIGKDLKVSKSLLNISKIWLLPSVVVKPEGMVVDQKRRPVIAIDSKRTDKPNLFVLTPME